MPFPRLTSRSNYFRQQFAPSSSLLAIMLFHSLMFLPSPSNSQSSCAFFHHLPQFAQLTNLPAEPQPVQSLGLSICQPKGPSCCTAGMEEIWMIEADAHLERSIRSKIQLIRQFFQRSAHEFRVELKNALQKTQHNLRLFFNKTYGRFFIQNQEIFDDFFSDLATLFSPNCTCQSDFAAPLERLLHRIYLAEFRLLNPLRSVDKTAEECMLNFFPSLRPFGPIPSTLANLLGRSFRLWTSLINALDGAILNLDALQKAFSLPSICSKALVRMQHCHLCTLASFGPLRPCPNFCQTVLNGCLVELAELGGQWDILIGTLMQLSPYMQTVHNPHSAFSSLPIQLSEAIMHFQEKGQLFSSRILHQCFGDEFLKLVNEKRKRRSDEEVNEFVNAEVEDTHIELLDFQVIQNAKKVVDHFTDGLIRLDGLWRRLARTICQEGGVQASRGEWCWNGRNASHHFRGSYRNGAAIQRRNSESGETKDKYAHIRFGISELARELATKNGISIEEQNDQQQQQKNANETGIVPSMREGIPIDDEDSVEGSAEEAEQNNYDEQEEVPWQNRFGHYWTSGKSWRSYSFSSKRSHQTLFPGILIEMIIFICLLIY